MHTVLCYRMSTELWLFVFCGNYVDVDVELSSFFLDSLSVCFTNWLAVIGCK